MLIPFVVIIDSIAHAHYMLGTQGYKHTIILNSVRQHSHLITQGNYKATCFDYRLVIFRSILSIESQEAMRTPGSHRGIPECA
jgi:hypothetical protein